MIILGGISPSLDKFHIPIPIIPIHAEGETHGSDVDQRGLSAKISCKSPKAGTKAYKLLRTEALNHLEWEKMKF